MGLIVLIVIQSVCALALLLHVAVQFYLAANAVRRGAPGRRLVPGTEPTVTIQLPIYNERHLAARAIDAMVALDYPPERLEVQVLDDSTDDTPSIVAGAIARHARSPIPIHHVQRSIRTGFKAGALANGLSSAKGELVAIFDADFVPEPDFLRRLVPAFADPRVAAAQARWGFLNREESWLTRAQAMILDNHFRVEQRGRANAASFTTFNGSAGGWRASAIRDAGGWRSDTLTEDLDLSCRALLSGWRLQYVDDVVVPSELPADLRAYRVQQYRWLKGTSQNAREHLGTVLVARLPLRTRLMASAHLLESSMYLVILALVLTTSALAAGRAWERFGAWPFVHPAVLVGAIGLLAVYYVAQRDRVHRATDVLSFLGTWVTFFVLTTGMVVHNGLAVLAGLHQRGGEFVRTPKVGTLDPRAERSRLEVPSETSWVLAAEVACWFLLVIVISTAAAGGYAVMVWFPAVTFVGLTAILVGEVGSRRSTRDAAAALRRAVRRVVDGEAS